MKKYDRLIFISFIAYFVIAVCMGIGLSSFYDEQQNYYRVEINRINDMLTGPEDISNINYSKYTYIDQVSFLAVGADVASMHSFYGDTQESSVIQPWFQGNEHIGYIKYRYEQPSLNGHQVIWFCEISLFVLQIGIIGILLFLRYRLIRPFYQLQALPEEIAKGHYKGQMKEEKTKFLGNFLWGMSQLQDTLSTSKQRQLQSEKEKKEILLSLSHDVKTPLNLIKLYTKAVKENVYQTPEEQQHALHQIMMKSDEIEKYIETIMKTSREDILDIQVKQSEFYLQQLIDKIRMQFIETCSIQKIDLSIGSYENKLLRGDCDRLQEVFENLFDNAIKYGDGKRIEITFYEEDYCQLVRFFNTGETLNETDRNHIFESFYRGANAKDKTGSGMGLYICREIMRKMDGEIFLQQEANGVAFILVLR